MRVAIKGRSVATNKIRLADFSGGINNVLGDFIPPANFIEDGNNILVDEEIGTVVKREGIDLYVPHPVPLDTGDAIVNVINFVKSDGSKQLIVHTKNGELYSYDTSWKKITTSVTKLSKDTFCDFAVFEDYLWIVNGIDIPRVYDGTSIFILDGTSTIEGKTSANLSYLNPKYVIVHQQRIFLLNTLVGSSCVFYSRPYDDTGAYSKAVWASSWIALNHFRVNPDDGDVITGAIVYLGDLYISKNRSLFALKGWHPNYSLIKLADIGTPDKKLMVVKGNELYFLSSKGLIKVVGNRIINLSEHKVKELRNIDLEKYFIRRILYDSEIEWKGFTRSGAHPVAYLNTGDVVTLTPKIENDFTKSGYASIKTFSNTRLDVGAGKGLTLKETLATVKYSHWETGWIEVKGGSPTNMWDGNVHTNYFCGKYHYTSGWETAQSTVVIGIHIKFTGKNPYISKVGLNFRVELNTEGSAYKHIKGFVCKDITGRPADGTASIPAEWGTSPVILRHNKDNIFDVYNLAGDWLGKSYYIYSSKFWGTTRWTGTTDTTWEVTIGENVSDIYIILFAHCNAKGRFNNKADTLMWIRECYYVAPNVGDFSGYVISEVFDRRTDMAEIVEIVKSLTIPYGEYKIYYREHERRDVLDKMEDKDWIDITAVPSVGFTKQFFQFKIWLKSTSYFETHRPYVHYLHFIPITTTGIIFKNTGLTDVVVYYVGYSGADNEGTLEVFYRKSYTDAWKLISPVTKKVYLGTVIPNLHFRVVLKRPNAHRVAPVLNSIYFEYLEGIRDIYDKPVMCEMLNRIFFVLGDRNEKIYVCDRNDNFVKFDITAHALCNIDNKLVFVDKSKNYVYELLKKGIYGDNWGEGEREYEAFIKTRPLVLSFPYIEGTLRAMNVFVDTKVSTTMKVDIFVNDRYCGSETFFVVSGFIKPIKINFPAIYLGHKFQFVFSTKNCEPFKFIGCEVTLIVKREIEYEKV